MIEFGCVTGRFQPVHNQHMELFAIALARCEHLVVAVTNPDPGARHEEPSSTHRHTAESNPFTYFERARLLNTAFAENGWSDRTTIVPFNLTRPEFWPNYVPQAAVQFVRVYSAWEREKARRFDRAGYPVTVIAGDPATKLCATDIRRAMLSGEECWTHHVPRAIVPVLRQLLAGAPMPDRT